MERGGVPLVGRQPDGCAAAPGGLDVRASSFHGAGFRPAQRRTVRLIGPSHQGSAFGSASQSELGPTELIGTSPINPAAEISVAMRFICCRYWICILAHLWEMCSKAGVVQHGFVPGVSMQAWNWLLSSKKACRHKSILPRLLHVSWFLMICQRTKKYGDVMTSPSLLISVSLIKRLRRSTVCCFDKPNNVIWYFLALLLKINWGGHLMCNY